jgi:hypothetical protein
VPTTPAWSAAVNGLPGDLVATNQAEQIDQFLGTHASTAVYDGTAVVTPAGGAQLTWLPMTLAEDYDQPITMSGTTIGRVQLPLLPVGEGANVLVSLWPDNGSGDPNTSGTPIASTLVPAAYVNNIAAPLGLDNPPSSLATERNNEYGFQGGVQSLPFLTPAGDASGAINNAVVCTTSDSMLFLGGLNALSSTILANCASTTAGGGVLAQPVPQTPLPQATSLGGATVVNGSTVVYCGGSITGTAAVTNVWAASWDSGSHTIGSWSAQTALPAAVQHPSVTSWNSTVYVSGGANASGTVVSSLYYATVTNGQVGSWETASLPIAVADVMTVAVAGWLFAIGGRSSLSSMTGLQSVYYTNINPADGSLGPWLTGPSLPIAQFAFASGWSVCATDSAIFQISGHFPSTSYSPGQVLTVTANGPALSWYSTVWYSSAGDITFLPVALGNGQWTLFAPIPEANEYLLSTISPMPYVSVPLCASGLTSGATYHVVLQAAAAASASAGVSLGTLNGNALPTVALQSLRHQGGWSAIPSGYSVPLTVWSGSTSTNGLIRHTWMDPVGGQAQAWGSIFYNSFNLLTGVAEATMQPSNPLNSNPTFTAGVSPWTAVNGTLAQSSAQTHGGFPFSGLLTPTGGSSQAYAASELLPAQQTLYGSAAWYLVTGWFYTPTTWGSFSLSVNWYDSSKAYITTSSPTASLTGATWTQVSYYVQPPATATYATIDPTMSGTPGSANTLYVSNCYIVQAAETVGAFTSLATVNYAAGVPWPPTSITQLN